MVVDLFLFCICRVGRSRIELWTTGPITSSSFGNFNVCHYLVLAGSVDRGQHRVLDETSLHKGCFLDNGRATPDRRQFVRQLQQCDDS